MAKHMAKHIAQESGKKKGQNYLHGAAILTAGVIIMKILGFFYKIPLGNILGDEGYSMFMGAYSIYFIFFTLATAGLPVALSRLVAEADANGRARQEQKLFRVALATFTVLGLVFAAIMFFFPHWLAAVYLENPDAAPSVRAMAPAILLVCMVSAYRGYCQGNGNMLPTTVDEVLEVLFKVAAGLVIAVLVLRAYEGKPNALPMGSAGAILGVSVGSAVSLLYMVFYKRRHYDELAAPYTAGIRDPNDVPEDDELVDSAATIVKNIFSIGVPIALGACIMALLNSVDSKLCMNRLQSAAGFNYQQAKVLYGVYGKAQTLFNLPAAFITPLTISIVPAISAALASGTGRRAGPGLRGLHAHLRRGLRPHGRGPGGAGRADHEGALSRQPRGRPGPAGGDGHRLLLRVHGADGKRHPPGLRQGEAHHGHPDHRRPGEDPDQLVPGGPAGDQHLRRPGGHPGELSGHGGDELCLHVALPGPPAPAAAGLRRPGVLQRPHGPDGLGGLRPLLARLLGGGPGMLLAMAAAILAAVVVYLVGSSSPAPSPRRICA